MKASELLPNPKNWRTHPENQRDALKGVLAEVGYADALLARETPDGLMLIDGHLRAETTPDQEVPVLVLDVDEREADMLLSTLDPMASLADTNASALEKLLDGVDASNPLRALLDAMVFEGQEAALEPSAAGVDERGSRLTQRAVAVRPVLSVEDVDVLERALALVGNPNRGKALIEICEEYLRAKGQHDTNEESSSSQKSAKGRTERRSA